MKILHLLYESKGDYFGFGGVAVRAYEIYSRLKCRHEITLLCKKYHGAYDRDIEGIKHVFVGNGSRNFTKAILSYACEASSFVRSQGLNYDVIIEEFSPAVPTFLCFYKKRPVILQIQGFTGKKYFEKYFFLKAGVLYFFEKELPALYKSVIAVSGSAIKRYKLQKNALNTIISNGIDARLLDMPAGVQDYILYLGRIDVHHKGIDILLEAYKKFYCQFPAVRLIIAGDFRGRIRLDDLINELPGNIKQNIDLAGWVDKAKKYELLQNALMVVMPSRYETQGIVALEAMACAKPVVVSDIPELSYVVEHGAGISFESENPHALCEAMRRMMVSNEREKMGGRGREWVGSFTWDNIAAQFENHLLKAADKRK